MARVFIEEYPHGPGGHCSSTAMRDLLKLHGHDFTEDMVFGLGVGIGFVYYSNPQMRPPVYIGGRIYNLEEHLCRHLGIDLELVTGLDNERGWREVKEMLDAGVPAVVHADVHYLDYLRAKVHFSGHRIVLVGYDERKGVAFVADNDRDEIQECSLESLARARSSTCLPQPADNSFYRFRVPGRLTPLEEAIPTALEKAVRYNIRLAPHRARFTYDGAKVVRGIQGLEEFAREMTRWPENMDSETLSLLCKSIYVTAEKGGTGYGGNFRRIYGRFLKEASPILSDPRLEEIGEEFTAIGDVWTDMSLTFKSLSADGHAAVEAACPKALEICNRERKGFEALEEVVLSEREGA